MPITRSMGNLSFFVPGVPQPKGSGSRVAAGVYLEAGTSASRKRKQAWYHTACAYAMVASGALRISSSPVEVSVVFRLPIPTSRLRGRRAIKPLDPHTSKPDVDKLCRAIGDSLTQSGVIADDSLIWGWIARKVYVTQGSEGAAIELRW